MEVIPNKAPQNAYILQPVEKYKEVTNLLIRFFFWLEDKCVGFVAEVGLIVIRAVFFCKEKNVNAIMLFSTFVHSFINF